MTSQNSENINPLLKKLGESATLAMAERCRAMAGEGLEIFKLGIGESPFPVPNFIVESLKEHAKERSYLPVRGLPELRDSVARYHKRTDGIDIKPDNVLIGPGTKILMYLLQLSHDGDMVVPSPCWVSYVPQANLIGKNVELIQTSFEDNWHLSERKLEEACEADPSRSRLLILNYPGNPDGGTYSEEELKAIAEVARKYEIILLSDEIYGEVHHQGQHVSISKFYPEGTIISSGLSKWASAGGWRLGTFAFPEQLEWLLKPMTKAAGQTFSSVASPIQWAGVTAFNGSPELDSYLIHARRILSHLSSECANTLSQSGARIHQSKGAFYLFPDFTPLAANLEKRGIKTGKELSEAILNEKHVATIPGVSFFRPPEELTLRMSYTNFDGAIAMKASEAIPLEQNLPDDFLEKYCGKTLEANRRICDFVNGN